MIFLKISKVLKPLKFSLMALKTLPIKKADVEFNKRINTFFTLSTSLMAVSSSLIAQQTTELNFKLF